MTQFPRDAWRKSSYSGDDHGMCVELAVAAGVVGVRDSKQGDSGPVLEFSRRAMAGFLRSLKSGAAHR